MNDIKFVLSKIRERNENIGLKILKIQQGNNFILETKKLLKSFSITI